MRLTRKVVKLTSAGAFIELEEGIDGFLHADDLSWTQARSRNAGSELQVGRGARGHGHRAPTKDAATSGWA
ncbi:MAG: S1 RNA-binding domain-containing protein [Bacillus subtilis]|nr:S1 RNA-binding domain-containing protein [Bacillus subtilis]